jgi:hypothetical protein
MADHRELTKRIKLINNRLKFFEKTNNKSIRYILSASSLHTGKRIRGLLVLLAGELFTSKINASLVDTAAAIELFHHATLRQLRKEARRALHEQHYRLPFFRPGRRLFFLPRPGINLKKR